jgi:hypothetical protein
MTTQIIDDARQTDPQRTRSNSQAKELFMKQLYHQITFKEETMKTTTALFPRKESKRAEESQ